ncbi:hypothetical protein PtrSN002B_001046 [Pyrenophora tritici-repentis]|nr:hypothetical protein PtrV1_03570 [Pyrenophora tritici-repentis]KAF7451242.1 hypothetical protein A1F99_030190 [Pyrenophora tritici-repentis]KAF7575647.1 hypothetical protein PtrM4_072710 [Pyrenophora tritici-repentis]KAG9385611.1 hypothetical protein A1F94_002361 [Pyrenophora tritici-repentis]KAI0585411.1 hypothetical protein Alg215_02509 [Pyrenophora tritici-repentis]
MSATKPDPDPAPFPFLRLPAEIRNRVYDFATQEMEGKTARLFPKPTPEPNILDKDLQPIESIGLMGVCQQIRKEFRPLFCGAWHVQIEMPSLFSFLATFAPLHIPNSPIAEITTRTRHDPPNMQNWDLWSFSQTINRLPNTVWKFGQRHRENRTHIYDCRCRHFNQVLTKVSILAREDTFVKLAPVPILKIRLDHVRKARGFSLNKWRILLQNEGDKLTSDQEMKVKELCQALSDLLPPNRARGTYRWGVHDMNEVLASRNLADVHVKVNNSKGQFMTKYVWQGERNTMTKKGVGKGK